MSSIFDALKKLEGEKAEDRSEANLKGDLFRSPPPRRPGGPRRPLLIGIIVAVLGAGLYLVLSDEDVKDEPAKVALPGDAPRVAAAPERESAAEPLPVAPGQLADRGLPPGAEKKLEEPESQEAALRERMARGEDVAPPAGLSASEKKRKEFQARFAALRERRAEGEDVAPPAGLADTKKQREELLARYAALRQTPTKDEEVTPPAGTPLDSPDAEKKREELEARYAALRESRDYGEEFTPPAPDPAEVEKKRQEVEDQYAALRRKRATPREATPPISAPPGIAAEEGAGPAVASGSQPAKVIAPEADPGNVPPGGLGTAPETPAPPAAPTSAREPVPASQQPSTQQADEIARPALPADRPAGVTAVTSETIPKGASGDPLPAPESDAAAPTPPVPATAPPEAEKASGDAPSEAPVKVRLPTPKPEPIQVARAASPPGPSGTAAPGDVPEDGGASMRAPKGAPKGADVVGPETAPLPIVKAVAPMLLVTQVTFNSRPERRSASIQLGQDEPRTVREGDRVQGIEIKEIQPGAIAMELAGTYMVLDVGESVSLTVTEPDFH